VVSALDTHNAWRLRIEEASLRTLAITQNITVDGSIEMMGDWFDPQSQADVDNSDLLDGFECPALRLLEAKAFRGGITYSRYARS